MKLIKYITISDAKRDMHYNYILHPVDGKVIRVRLDGAMIPQLEFEVKRKLMAVMKNEGKFS